VVHKLRHYHDHPGFLDAHVAAVRRARDGLPTVPAGRTRLVFTAHSIPVSMARGAGPDGGRYEAQLREAAGLVAAAAAPDLSWDLVWQSRSGPPRVPWLEPDVNDHLEALAAAGTRAVVVSPIGFISDHLEVVWDLDTEAAGTAKRLGLDFVRAATPGVAPGFVTMIGDLVRERIAAGSGGPAPVRRGRGTVPVWDTCPEHCCPAPTRARAAG
jgi:protoporphyrin/coproporphyrin ferrochelatase